MRKIFDFFYNYSSIPDDVNRLIVSAFLELNNLKVESNLFLKELIIQKDDSDFKDFTFFLKFFDKKISFEDLVQMFEFVISPADKTINGAVYTPEHIRKYIVKKASQNLNADSLIGDIACGCGGFLLDYAIIINRKFKKSFESIFRENVFGVDITEYSVIRTKILLSLLAVSKGEDIPRMDFNFYVGNSLSFDWFAESERVKNNKGFDIIVGNPPYVGATNINDDSKHLLKNWSVMNVGKADLYIPFFEIGLFWLTDNGTLGYITVNTFYKSVNGRGLRKLFSEFKYDFRLVDFGGEQIFGGRNTYTCICIIRKKEGGISFVKAKSTELDKLRNKDFSLISYDALSKEGAWLLNDNLIEKNVKKIEEAGQKISDFLPIKNGFATLRNRIYLFTPIGRKDGYYLLEYDNETYKIEENICRDAIKPNILKEESEIEKFKEKLIFPYKKINGLFKNMDNGFSVIEESFFKKEYPYAYKYLKKQKSELAKRDKGNKTYPAWYAFGRTQALNIKGKKLFFPYLSNKPYFVFSDEEYLFFYNGYAIVSDSERELRFLQKILKSSVFWYYIKHTSKPYTGEYYSLAKNYIKNFGICEMSEKEKEKMLKMTDESEINTFLIEKYDLEF